VAEVLGINRAEVLSSGRQPHRVQARSLGCFWASRELGMSMVELSKRVKISQPSVSQSANRCEKIAKENKLNLLQSKYSIYQGTSHIFPCWHSQIYQTKKARECIFEFVEGYPDIFDDDFVKWYDKASRIHMRN